MMWAKNLFLTNIERIAIQGVDWTTFAPPVSTITKIPASKCSMMIRKSIAELWLIEINLTQMWAVDRAT